MAGGLPYRIPARPPPRSLDLLERRPPGSLDGQPARHRVGALRARDTTLKATEQPINIGTAIAKTFFDMLGVFAEFETNLRQGRQPEGIASKPTKGI